MTKIKVYDRGDAIGMYLDWFNNFLTIQRFASYYGISEQMAINIIDWGRDILNNQHYHTNVTVPVSIQVHSNLIKVIQ